MSKHRDGWGWLLALFTVAGFIEAVFYGQMSAFTPLYLPKLGIPQADVAAWTGLTVAISGLVGLPFLPLWGALADRYSRQPIIIRSFFAHLLAAIVALLAGNVWIFIIGRSIMSFSLGNSGLMMTTLFERAPERRQGLAFSIMNSAAPVGSFVGPLIGGPVVDQWGFRMLLAVDAALMLVVIVALAVGYRDHFKGNSKDPLLRMAVDSVHVILQSRRLRTLFPALILLFSGWMLAFTYIPLAVTELYTGSNPASIIGFVMGAGGLVALFISPLIGALGDRYGLWRILFISVVIEIILWPIPALTGSLVSFGIAWAALNGIASGVFALSFSVLALSTSNEVRGRVMSFSYLPVVIGSTFGPAIGSLVTGTNIFTIFPLAAVLTTVGLLVLFVSYRQVMPQSTQTASHT